MIIECEENPHELISEIGDPYFWIYRHPKHPHVVRIRDAEDEVMIDISGEDAMVTAKALCKLLNQDYVKVS